MSTAARILTILILTLGFPLHNFVMRVATAHPCVVLVEPAAGSENAEALPDTPKPSCKVIGALQAPGPKRHEASGQAFGPTRVNENLSAWWPGGPEKPPKHG
jgi:hypothetical protein